MSFERSFHVALHYRVLAGMDLGRDAANLCRPDQETPTWAAELTEAYLAAPGRLQAQGLPLVVADIAELFVALETERLLKLSDPAGQKLRRQLVAALESEASSATEVWEREASSAEARRVEVETALGATLERLLRGLWGRSGRPAPPLRVFDAPALGPCGRGALAGGIQRVAVSLSEPLVHVLCQVFHEAVHSVSDRELGDLGAGARDTRLGQPGHAVHRAIESHAVEVGAEVIATHGPDWTAAYARWRLES